MIHSLLLTDFMVEFNANTLLTLVGMIGSSIVYAFILFYKLARIDVKVETLWAFQMRRAMSEAVLQGAATLNSPLTFTPEALATVNPLKPALIEWWNTRGKNLSHIDALFDLELKFGEKLVQNLCLPHKYSHGACILLALAVASNSSTIDLILAPPSLDFKLKINLFPERGEQGPVGATGATGATGPIGTSGK